MGTALSKAEHPTREIPLLGPDDPKTPSLASCATLTRAHSYLAVRIGKASFNEIFGEFEAEDNDRAQGNGQQT